MVKAEKQKWATEENLEFLNSLNTQDMRLVEEFNNLKLIGMENFIKNKITQNVPSKAGSLKCTSILELAKRKVESGDLYDSD